MIKRILFKIAEQLLQWLFEGLLLIGAFYLIAGVFWLVSMAVCAVVGVAGPRVSKWVEEAQKPPPPKTYILQRAGHDTYTITERK